MCQAAPLNNMAATDKLRTMCRGVWARIRYERNRVKQQDDQDQDDQEVEQKFCVPRDYQQTLESHGASLKSVKSLVDEYFDTVSLTLLQRDVWCRKRGDKWELKIPPEGLMHGRESAGMTQYREVVGKTDVAEEVMKISDTSLEDLTRLVLVEATRETWMLEDYTISIDTLEDGWSVGEIELMTSAGKNIESVKQRIQALGEQLNFEPLMYGKVRYLLEKQNHPAVKILRAVSGDIK